jgi:hypothetical protein
MLPGQAQGWIRPEAAEVEATQFFSPLRRPTIHPWRRHPCKTVRKPSTAFPGSSTAQ